MNAKRNILVTGGAGFIGSHMAKRLLNDGHTVTVVDCLSTGFRENVPEGAEFINCDISSENAKDAISAIEFDAVFHLAAQSSGETSFKDPVADLKSHVLGTLNLLEVCKAKDVKRFLYSGSMAIYGDPEYLPVDEKHPLNPKSYYSAGKISAENYIRLFGNMGIESTVFRLFSVYGPGQNLKNKEQGMISIFLSYMLEGDPVIVKGSFDRFRDFVFIDDVVDVWMKALDNPATYGKTYNLGTGVKTTVGDIIEALKLASCDPDYPVEQAEGTPGDQFGVVGDISLLNKDMNWKPQVELEKGIASMVNYEKRRVKVGN